MSAREIILENAIPILGSLFVSLLATYLTLRAASKRAKQEKEDANRRLVQAEKNADDAKYKAGRPRFDLSQIMLYPEKNEVYVGKEVPWGSGNLIDDSDYKDIVMELGRKRENTVLRHKEQDYLFFNLCPKDTQSTEKVVLSIDALSVKFAIDSKITKIYITEAFSEHQDGSSYTKDMGMDVLFHVVDPFELEFEIPLAYACIAGDETSFKLEEIYKLKKAGETTPIDFMKERSRAKKFIAFAETGCLLVCETNDKPPNNLYEFSLYWKIDEKTKAFLPYRIEDDRDLFDKKLRGRDIVQQ
ncbi:MAG: hypothetical protein FWE28_01290 [Oscillospiraceae bacterium]|nr:hypothetical protein [Oscillospiraceae bacterium]